MQPSDDVYLCLTWRGTIITRDTNGMPFLNETLEAGIPPNAARFSLHCSSAGSKLAITARLLPGSPALAAGAGLDPPAIAVIPAGTGRATYLHLGKNFAITPKDGVLLQGRPQPDALAVFVFVPERELLNLLFIRDNQWLSGTGGLIRCGETGFLPGFIFNFGETTADLRHGPAYAVTPQAGAAEASPCLAEVALLRDGWKIAGQLRLFRPLIYYAAFGRQPIFEQLRWSLRSLSEFGLYTGAVHLITDRPAAEILELAPPALRGRLTVQSFIGLDFWDFAFARMHLPEWQDAASFQPILYVDTDIAFDRPVEPLLHNIALSRHICVAAEPFSKLTDADAVGGPLFRQSGVATAEDCGFNSGCQGFANLAMARRYFALTRHVAESFRAFHPGGIAQFGDQPFANYVAANTETINTALVGAAMRLSFPPPSAAPDERTGMVHFWPSRPAERKRAAMQDYIEALIGAAPAPADATPPNEEPAPESLMEAAG